MEKIYERRLEEIRSCMESKGWDAVIINSLDPHKSEYVSERWMTVKWVTGFEGEGEIVITQDHAGLWTDSRYFIEAEKIIYGSQYTLHKTRVPDAILIPEWLAYHFSDKASVAVALDGLCHSSQKISEIKSYFQSSKYFDESGGLNIISIPDMMDMFIRDRAAIPANTIITLPEEFTSHSHTDKIMEFKAEFSEKGYKSALISSLDEIAWMLNIRGSDIECNPLAISYLLITDEDVKWFVKKRGAKYDDTTKNTFYELMESGIKIFFYDELESELSVLQYDDKIPLLLDSNTVNYHISNILSDLIQTGKAELLPSEVSFKKAVKNAAEIEGMKKAHLTDGIAMEMFLYWLEQKVSYGDDINEKLAAEKLHEIRTGMEGFVGESFPTISAYGANAALPHYSVPEYKSEYLYGKGLYLCDSGAHYFYGTTDITRTIPLGKCTDLEKEDYTLVLKGHIDLAMSVFPKGTAGCHLDAIARMPLWTNYRNFGHGTGHGVGCFLNVHEGPHDIRPNFNNIPILPGMITSDEPGIYRQGKFGVRHENLLLCVDAGTNEFGKWNKFEVLTLCHIDTSVIKPELLTKEEIGWLNDYNERVYAELSPFLPAEIARWLKKKTKPID